MNFNRARLLQWSIFLITIPLVLAPILPIIYQSFIDRPLYDRGAVFTLDAFRRLFTHPELPGVIVNSMVFAFLSTLFSQGFGALFAILISRTDMPGRRIFSSLLIWPLIISGLVLGFGWFMTYGSAGFVTLYVRSLIGFEPWSLYSVVGMSLVAGTTQLPLALLYCMGSLALSDASLEDAARTCGASPWHVIRHITLPLLLPAIVYSGVLNFTAALETLSIPLIFGEPAGIKFFTTFLYTHGLHAGEADYGLVGTAAILLLVIVLGLVMLQSFLLRNSRRFVTVSGKASRQKLFALGRLRWPAFALVALYVVLFVALPVGTLFLRSVVSYFTPLIPFWELWTQSNFTGVLSLPTAITALYNTIIISFVGGILATVFIAMIAIVVNRSDFPLRGPLNYAALLPRALPGLVAGIGFFYATILIPPMGWLRNGIWILIIAYTMRAIPTGFGAIAPTLLQISGDLDRSARVMGADWIRAIRSAVFPVLKPALFTTFTLLFINFFKEYSIAVFLIAPGSEVLGTTMLQFWNQGLMGHVAALSVIQIVLTVLFVFAAQKLFKVKVVGGVS